MASIISKNKNNNENNPENLTEETGNPSLVSTHIYLKPPHSTETLEKQVVLRRIRHRKRINKVRTAVQALLGSPTAANPDKVSANQMRWVDDAFAAP